MNPGVNRGYRTNMLNKEGKLRAITSASGPAIYRGDNFPKEYYGIGVTPEPAGNLVTATRISRGRGKFLGEHLYNKKEILASADERFRPVNVYTAPDGSLYILDMYRGIIQHKIFVTSYLKKQIEARNLDKGVNLGRIYRLRWEKNKLTQIPKMEGKSSSFLARYLSHKNGWTRDKARQLIIENQDTSKGVIRKIKKLLNSRDSRVVTAALWTLEGLNKLDLSSILKALNSKDTRVINQGLILSSKIPSKYHNKLGRVINNLNVNNYDLALHVASYASSLRSPPALKKVIDILNSSQFKGIPFIAEGTVSGLEPNEDFF